MPCPDSFSATLSVSWTRRPLGSEKINVWDGFYTIAVSRKGTLVLIVLKEYFTTKISSLRKPLIIYKCIHPASASDHSRTIPGETGIR